MSIRALDGGVVQLDDCLLDCGTAVVVSAAFGGAHLGRIRQLLLTAPLEPALRGAIPSPITVFGPAGCAGTVVQPGAQVPVFGGVATALGHGARLAWLVEHGRHGTLLHAPAAGPLDDAAVKVLMGQRVVTLTHEPSEQLRRQLGDLELRALPAGRRVLVTGGSRSGKSAFAEALLADQPGVGYVAAGAPPDPADGEWAARIELHRRRRPRHWTTRETLDLAASFGAGPVLVDSLGSWLTGILDRAACWDDPGVARRVLASETEQLLGAYERSPTFVVLVTDEVGSGVVPAHASGRLFRDELGRLNAALAAVSDEVWLVTAGIGNRLR
jgi:adenosyl cobinamide kinase/adenosyl cobinamide phosphate guanylyltransferase